MGVDSRTQRFFLTVEIATTRWQRLVSLQAALSIFSDTLTLAAESDRGEPGRVRTRQVAVYQTVAFVKFDQNSD